MRSARDACQRRSTCRRARLPHPAQRAAHGRGAGPRLHRARRSASPTCWRSPTSTPCATGRRIPEWEGRDRFLLSIGHYAIALYAALIEAGIIPEDELETYGIDDSRLPMSGMASYTPGMEISGGSLGLGLAHRASACALGLKRKKSDAFVYMPVLRRRARRGLDLGGGDVGAATGSSTT